VIFCVGETLEEREKGINFLVAERQIEGGLKDIGETAMQSLVVAYEPVWAIGTGKTATPRQAEEAHQFIRQKIRFLYSPKIAENLRIQYGGSVTPENIKSLMAEEDIDGALVGGTSLNAESFSRIVRFKEM